MGYDDGKIDGIDIGYNDGYEDGESDGYETGYNKGYQVATDNTYEAIYDDIYNKGYKDGQKTGMNNKFYSGLEKWIVPAIIVVLFFGLLMLFPKKRRINMLILTDVNNDFTGLSDLNILTIVLVLFLVLNTIIFITKFKWLH